MPEQTNACLHFHCAATQRPARMLHSLVRVSRRVECSHLITNNYSARCDQSPVRADIRQQTLHAVPVAVPKCPKAAQAKGLHCLSRPRTTRRMTIGFTPRSDSAMGNCCWPALHKSADEFDSYPESKTYRLLQTSIANQHRS